MHGDPSQTDKVLFWGPLVVLLLPILALQIAGQQVLGAILTIVAGLCWLMFSLRVWRHSEKLVLVPTLSGLVLVVASVVRLFPA